MTHHSFLTPIALLALLTAAGCNTATDDSLRETAAQDLANGKIAAAAKEAQAKTVAAQAAADRSIASANASFMRLREDYRHQTTLNVVELDRAVAVLEASSKTVMNKDRALREASLVQIRAKREAFGADYMALEAATAGTWDDAKAHIEKEWSELKALVDKA